jgi:hypothetical protein
MTKAAELAKMGEVLTNSQIGGRRNIIINGAMQVAQRGTSFTGVGDGDNAYYLDRFEFVESGSPNGVFTLSQSSTAPEGFGNSLKFDCTTAESSLAANEQIRLRQKVEGQNLQQFKKGTSNAEKMTVSFYVRSNLTGTAIVNLYDGDNNRHTAKSYTIDSANTWERKTITFDGDTTGAFDDDNATSLDVIFYLQAGTNFSSGTLATTWASHNDVNSAAGQTINIASSTDNEFFITGVQLEVGSVATPFEHRSFGEELVLCQRYFYQAVSGNAQAFGMGTYYASNLITMVLDFPTTMRAAPSVTVGTGTGFYVAFSNNQGDSFDTWDNVQRANPNYVALDVTADGASGTAGHGCALATHDASAFINVDAEL